MSYIYAMSDIHGCYDPFEDALSLVDLSGDNQLILLGDYVHYGKEPYKVLDRIMELEKRYGRDKVIVLAGNHEDMAVTGEWSIGVSRFDAEPLKSCPKDAEYIKWMKGLRRYYTTDKQIFCHAGVDEEAEDLWEWGTNDYIFTQKYPATFGKFYKDIIVGHIGTADISGDRSFHDIYYDGKSHYYIDGTVEKSGVIPVLKYHTDTNRYYQATPSRDKRIYTYEGLF